MVPVRFRGDRRHDLLVEVHVEPHGRDGAAAVAHSPRRSPGARPRLARRGWRRRRRGGSCGRSRPTPRAPTRARASPTRARTTCTCPPPRALTGIAAPDRRAARRGREGRRDHEVRGLGERHHATWSPSRIRSTIPVAADSAFARRARASSRSGSITMARFRGTTPRPGPLGARHRREEERLAAPRPGRARRGRAARRR